MTDIAMRAVADRPGDPEQIDHIVIRFAGDSGDGMQLTGDRFTSASALFGNDLSTFPDYPAEIRAPAGTVNGVSSFQVHISDHDITTPGDAPGVLVAMNPAALKADLGRLVQGGTLILNVDTFDERNLEKADFTSNPLDDGSLNGYRVIKVPMTSLTKEAAAPLGVKPRDADRSKNFFALGLVSFMYSRPTEPTLAWIDDKYGKNDLVRQSNRAAFLAGYHYGETTEEFGHRFMVKPAHLPPGEYTNINGNTALAWGLVAAAQLAKLPLTLGSYPITPASDILHELSKHKNFGVRTVQAEDEIAAAGARDRGVVRRAPGHHHHVGSRRRAEERGDLAGGVARAAVPAHRHPARRPVDRPAHQDRSGRPATSPCSAVTVRHRCRSSPRTARRTASTRRSRRPASRSSTARR